MGQLRVQGRNLVNGRSVLSAFGERRYVRDGMLKGESFTDKLVPKPDGIDWKWEHCRKRNWAFTVYDLFRVCCFCVLTSYFSTATFLCKTYHGGHLTIRLALGGCTNRPFYRIVAAHNKCPRDGRFVEQLGSFDPLPNSNGEKLVALNLNRIRYWIGCGAHLSKPMEKLLGLSGFYPLHPMMITNAERLRRKRAQEALLASQKTESEPGETEASWCQCTQLWLQGQGAFTTLAQSFLLGLRINKWRFSSPSLPA